MKMNLFRPAVLAAPLAAALAAAPALAQDGEAQPRRDLIVTIGGGAQAYPRYPGSDELKIGPLPILNFRKAGDPLSFEAPDEGIGFGILGAGSPINIGPAVQLQGKRKERHVGAPVGNVGFTVEAGAFVQAFVMPNLRIRLEGRKGIGGHEGLLGDISADLMLRDADRTVFSIGPRLRLSNGRYQRAYFGVSPAVSGPAGLPVYRPDGGIHAVGVATGITHQFSETWGIYAYAAYDRLVGDAGDSPLVRSYGKRDQPSFGLGLSYSFRIKRGPKD
jgi:MipA family protein